MVLTITIFIVNQPEIAIIFLTISDDQTRVAYHFLQSIYLLSIKRQSLSFLLQSLSNYNVYHNYHNCQNTINVTWKGLVIVAVL